MITRFHSYTVSAFGISDVGLVRQNNEDVWGQLPEFPLFILADGMGGHQAGEVAAKTAVFSLIRLFKRKLKELPKEAPLKEWKRFLKESIQRINLAVYKKGRTVPELKGMGTTLCCVLFHGEGIIYAHVGDSRVYLFKKENLIQLTQDHSLLRALLNKGALSEEDASDFVYKNIITKAIGQEPSVEPSMHTLPVSENDLYLICSDGLSDMIPKVEIEMLLKNSPNLEEGAEHLVRAAKERGGLDNVTVVLMKVSALNEMQNLSR